MMNQGTTVTYGTLFTRKPKGKKLTFMVSGVSLAVAHNYVKWEYIYNANLIVVFVDFSNNQYRLHEDGKFDVLEVK